MEYTSISKSRVITDKMNKCDKLIEYVQTLNLSDECTNAIIDMANYEKETLLNELKEV